MMTHSATVSDGPRVLGQHLAQAAKRDGADLGHDAAHQGRRGRHFQRGEQVRQAGRNLKQPEDLHGRGAVGSHQIELQGVRAAQALGHADGDGKKGDVGGNHRFGKESLHPELAQQHRQHGRERHDRHGLRGHQPRQGGPLKAAAAHQQGGEHKPQHRGQRQPQQGFSAGDQRIVGSAGRRKRRHAQALKAAGKLPRRGNHRVAELGGARQSCGAAEIGAAGK